IGNAIKFTPEGTVSVRAVADAGARVARIVVRDTGIGVAPDKQTRLFEPFVQADGTSQRKHGGTGLGLSISRRLAEMMGGTLELSSPGLGKGTTLTLALPLA
ncbi:MAG: hybrid sensor histidine kinase/response regulator, partial [Anaerolineales bacterium]|nr:hybrid sensor histidine kinase/response regulator [Anaerolineales bacterium]